MRTNATIKDVARRAGVSKAAVSFCLNDVPGEIAKETKRRIRKAIRDLHYVPSSCARALATGKTYLLGVISFDLLFDPYTVGLKGIEEEAKRRHMSLIVGDAERSPVREREYAKLLLERGSEGMIILSASSEKTNTVLDSIAKEIPVVLINRPWAGNGFYKIAFENRQATKKMVGELISAGERNILFLSYDVKTWALCERQQGYEEAMREAGIKPQTCYVSLRSEVEAERMIENVLKKGNRFTAIVCGSGILAALVWRVMSTKGMRIPDDISLTGFDEVREIKYLVPSITTIRQPFREAGGLAVDILMKVREGKTVRREWCLESEILWRDSVVRCCS